MDRRPISSAELSRLLCFEDGNEIVDRTQGEILNGCVKWSSASGVSKGRGIDLVIFEISRLEIHLESNGTDSEEDRIVNLSYGIPDYPARLTFVDCHFKIENKDIDGLAFVPICLDVHEGENIQFERNEGSCEFLFSTNSTVVFKENDFGQIVVRTVKDTHGGNLSFYFEGNRCSRLEWVLPTAEYVFTNYHFIALLSKNGEILR